MPEDPKQKLTGWLTEGLRKPTDTEKMEDIDRTRLMFPGQKEWYHAALSLDDEYFRTRVLLDMKMMMAFKGRRSMTSLLLSRVSKRRMLSKLDCSH